MTEKALLRGAIERDWVDPYLYILGGKNGPVS